MKKISKRILQAILVLYALLCGLVVLCAFRPDVTDMIAGFLYPDRGQAAEQETESSGQADTTVNLPGISILGNQEPGGSVSLPGSGEAEENGALNGPGDSYAGGNLSETGAGDLSGTGNEEMPDSGNASGAGTGGGGAGTGNRPDQSGESEDQGSIRDTEPDYVQPQESDLNIPEKVSGKNGYQPIEEQGEQLSEEAAGQLENGLDAGATGAGLSFDERFYPYYAMLDETEQRLYCQIYANANALNDSFAPVEDVTKEQLNDIFSAVYNDHPELFWLDTAYSCKYRRNGQCVEIDLQFNRTAKDLQRAKDTFNARADEILALARSLGSDYEKERYIHDALIDSVEYNEKAEMNQSAYSALVNGQTVCAGYARAFQYLLQQLRIPCYYCTGFAGESHAWNIVELSGDYYNVDTTWDDTDGGIYDYFNRTDQEFGNTHIRQELSVYLPLCSGQLYRGPEQGESEDRNLSSIADIGISEQEVLYNLPDYYVNCFNQITEMGLGSYEFYNVIEGEALLEEWYEAYQTGTYIQGYMENAVLSAGASYYEMSLAFIRLQQDRYLLIHSLEIR